MTGGGGGDGGGPTLGEEDGFMAVIGCSFSYVLLSLKASVDTLQVSVEKVVDALQVDMLDTRVFILEVCAI